MKFVATKKVSTNFFSTPLFSCCFWIRDPRSGIRKKPIPDPGSRGQKGTGSGSATLPKTYGSYGSGNQNLRNLYYFLFMMEWSGCGSGRPKKHTDSDPPDADENPQHWNDVRGMKGILKDLPCTALLVAWQAGPSWPLPTWHMWHWGVAGAASSESCRWLSPQMRGSSL